MTTVVVGNFALFIRRHEDIRDGPRPQFEQLRQLTVLAKRFALEGGSELRASLAFLVAVALLVGCQWGAATTPSYPRTAETAECSGQESRASAPKPDAGGRNSATSTEALLAHDGAAAQRKRGCVKAELLWSEDFESANYRDWTSKDYAADWGNDCQDNGFSTQRAHRGSHSHRSEITCPNPDTDVSHRGYGGLQFDGDEVLDSYTNHGTGIDAPHGVVNTFWSWLATDATFRDGKWFSFWTINSACDWSDSVLTLGLEDATNRLAVAHYWRNDGGTRTYTPNAPSFPLGEWVRTTIYVNYHENEMHVWQNGQSVSHVTFDRSATTICQWHWGAYASGDNEDIVLYEDDISLWKLKEPWRDFSVEPWLGESHPVCD